MTTGLQAQRNRLHSFDSERGEGEKEEEDEEEEKKREQTIAHTYQCKCLPLLWRSFEDYNDTK